jgi:hypothetical protein
LSLRATIGAARLEIVGWWAASRALVFASAAVAQVIGWPRASWHPSLLGHPLILLGFWDGRWYRRIAEHGYLYIPGRTSDPAFFPLLPILEHAAQLLGVSTLVAGVAIANIALLVGLLAFYELGRRLLPETDARRAAMYVAIFPYTFVFSMAYPEALALACIALAGLLAVRGRWAAAACAAAAATLARPEGAFLVIPLAAIAAAQWASLPERRRAWAVTAALAGPAALASFSLYLWSRVGDPLAWSKAEAAWGRSFSPTGVYRAAEQLLVATQHHDTWIYRDAASCVVYVGLLAVALHLRLPLGWILFGAAIVLLPLASGTFTSDGRFGLLALPVFWALAALGRSSRVHRLVTVASPLLLVLFVLTIRSRFP